MEQLNLRVSSRLAEHLKGVALPGNPDVNLGVFHEAATYIESHSYLTTSWFTITSTFGRNLTFTWGFRTMLSFLNTMIGVDLIMIRNPQQHDASMMIV